MSNLIFDDNFNEILDKNTISNSVTHITFGKYHNQKIEPNILPNTLLELNFGHNYNYELKPVVLPKTLLQIKFGSCYHQKIDFFKNLQLNIFPVYLTEIIFDGNNQTKYDFNLYKLSNLKRITFHCSEKENNICVNKFKCIAYRHIFLMLNILYIYNSVSQ